jgi:hypothetical protein
MKYNRSFIAAVQAVQEAAGDVAAEAVFNKLFDVKLVPTLPEDVATQSPAQLRRNMRSKVGCWIYMSDIFTTNDKVGVPGKLGTNAVAWIKSFRELTCMGLKQSKDAFDFVRDNPTVLDDIIDD